jgi:arylsulfatase A-like enzyme
VNLVLVTVDCMRRDRVSAYGYERRTTPFLDRLLDRALHCSSAHSASSWTCPSVCTLLTGLYPHHHGGGLVPGEPKSLSKHNLPTRLPEEIPTLSDVLRARGYATAAFGAVWNAHLSLPGRFPTMAMLEKPGPRVLSQAMGWVKEQDGPFFLWLHLGDAHEPLNVPRRLRKVFGPVPRMRNVRRWEYTKSGDDVGSARFERYREARVRMYDAAVRSADGVVASLWEALGAAGLRERTLLALTADHGEEFWEHREEELEAFTDPRDVVGTGHGHNLFQVHLLVPLVFAGPGIEPAHLRHNVTLADVVPTLAQAMGFEAPPGDGSSLLEAVDPSRPILAEAIAYGHEKRTVVRGDLKLLAAPGDRFDRVYRLGPDRREAGVVEDRATAEELGLLLPREAGVVGEQVEATDEIVAHLRDLGYLE